jgi:hypothetical protein
LEAANIDYVITGSIALILYAEPRLTHDIDIVVHLKIQDAKRIPIIFSENEYYCPPVDILIEEIKRPEGAQFNVIHHDSGFKADFFLSGNDPLHEYAFSKKRRMPIGDELDPTGIAGSWSDSRSAAEIIANIHDSRKSKR